MVTASATGLVVYAGPVEATAIGNIAVQLIGIGALRDIDEARSLIQVSFPPAIYEPSDVAKWDEAYSRFVGIVQTERRMN
jgi:sugar (pentulose or hexulose) kinase